jgi:ribosomal protein S7
MEHEIRDSTSFGVQINNAMSKLRYNIVDRISNKIMKDVQKKDEKVKIVRAISSMNCALIIVADKNNKGEIAQTIDKSLDNMKKTLDGGEATADKMGRIQ